MMDFGHVLTAMVTPFDAKGNVDLEKVERLVEFLLANGTEGLVVAGTTGESPTLREEEKLALFEKVVTVVNKRVPVIAGTGSNNTYVSAQLTKKATALGVDGIMAVTPYYNKPSQEGMYAHFAAIAEATHLPVMLYNIPSRSVVNLSAETIVKLSYIPNITSLKEANGDLDHMVSVIEQTPDTFHLYSGDDSLTLPALSIGAKGVVSVASHIIGPEMQQMMMAFRGGDVEHAANLHRKLLPIMKGLFTAPNPTCVKAALQIKGFDTGGVRLPLVPPTSEQRQHLQFLIEQLKVS
ncbi:4-hydroxy-tetrahydrodipicolinate synthase [Halalkalibacterium halodurans]|nr:4-hydroxy-tetrahydrodipicolinate synthase [Halalkalibacterium halodurans]MDY7222947.1 4-hydroxy-tetrahydrodipicolinate synthase [Halalkalibacterium halodurans]MDY7242168.1 4-hydroxy-tetrahydrodipicolinate synthase [Halalkalibacterium halodurans]MED4080064.1 4-hydroxy-tetrahydrodipicolinate synthase [Halalkalibacterium halodurans]MED4086831.1 4-hydroxy-tetrahydrodipicolinate synthase [Halalkalibacterium halodurans]MED4104257.1 4-hydroxy-tetrahydrodipicolinate synthase [Halalkalibacterium hal